jgi:hypothetical protein
MGFEARYFAPMFLHQSIAALGEEILRSRSTDCTHIISAVASVIAFYSTSILDRDTVFCFFAHHEIRFEPRNTVKPPVDFLSSEQPAQSASEKALTLEERDFLMCKPMPIVCLRYRRILLTAVQCELVRECRY